MLFRSKIQYNGKGISENRSHQSSPTQFACVGLISTLSSFFGKCSESPHRANRAVTWETFGALQTGFSPVPPWKHRCFPVPAECRSPGKWAFGCPFWKVPTHRSRVFRRVGRLPKLAYPFSWWYTSRSLMSMAFRRCFRSDRKSTRLNSSHSV